MPTQVPRLWPGSTIVCLGCGPSLTKQDVESVRGVAKVIAINETHALAPWADVLYACDERWWRKHRGVPKFAGLKYGLEAGCDVWPGVQRITHTGKDGLELNPESVRHGKNSGYQAINLAVHFGASRILLLGYDMRDMNGRHHFIETRSHDTHYSSWLLNFQTLVEPLTAIGVDVINCTPKSALKCFPQRALSECLPVLA